MLKNKTALHPIFKRLYAFMVCTLLALIGIVGGGVLKPALGAVDVGANPTPKVDIAVALPSDYQGTFLEFKQELTQKLIAQGMDPGSFRITDTAAKIDTSNTEGWLVYNHNTGSVNIANYFNKDQGKLTNTTCQSFSSHIYNFTEDGKTSMIFAGYPDIAAFDAMIYPAPSNARRTFSFDVNGSAVRTHTLNSTGFMMNVGKNPNGTLTGYYLRLTGTNNAISNAAIYQVSNYNPTNNSVIGGTQVGTASQATNLGPVNKARFTVDLRETSVTVQKQNYDASGNLGTIETLFNGPVALVANGYNGFGPYMQNSSHGCNEFTQFSFLDLEMNYDSSAFDALKTVQYYEGAQQKYFINVVGDSNDPQIPDETDETYSDGINRMNENEIFYLSNAQDGKIVTDSTKDAEGNITHQGLGAKNGYIAMSDDYVTELADYIYTSFIEGKKFDTSQPVTSPIPLANFYMVDASTKTSETPTQIMTIHQRHLLNTNTTFAVNIRDKSKVGQLAGTGEDARIAQWKFTVLDPDNNQVATSGWVDHVSKIPDFVFDKDSKNGKWIFELTVKDQNGNESKASQTYITAFLDDKVPLIEGTNSSKNTATFTFTDTGQGIDDDGITFIEDNRGSGVAAYWITNDENATPTETDWEYFDEVSHTASVDYELDSTQPVVVWVKDECGNLGAKTVFQPTRVQVQDPDGNPIDDYIVIGEKPIIVLPDEDDLDNPDDPEDKFSGWTTPKGEPVTPGTDVPVPEDHTIIIRPSYAKDYANLIYLANGGQIAEGNTAASTSFRVISGNSILQKIEDQKVLPVREGYSFKGWKLVAGDTNAVVDGLVNKEAGTTTATGNQLISPDDQVAKLVKIDESDTTAPAKPENIKKNNYYLVAQWEIGDYTVRLDANGGSLGATRSFEGIKYQANVGALNLPLSGRTIPAKPGYIFQGWSTTKNPMDNTANTFAVAGGVTGITPIAAPTMPAHDITIYAVWKEDKEQFVVHFDSAGGSRVSDQAYKNATATNYIGFKTPTRPGYDFGGWFLVTGDVLGDTAYTGDEAIATKTEHTFRAKWTPRDDTKYTVDYYVNSGNKDANGNYLYTKVNNLDDGTNPTKTYTATTESTQTVPEADKVPEIATGGKSYWYNPDSSHVVVSEDGTQQTVNNNVFTGTVTGNPTLSLKLYYDRYFDVTVEKDPSSDGEGTCESAIKQKEGTTPTVTWAASAGSHVERVIVNGVMRDDLLDAGSYTVEDPLTQDVKVSVVFAKDPVIKPDVPEKPKPPVTVDTHFTISTRVEGTTAQDVVALSPTQSVKNGENAQVTWSIAENSRYTISSVKVDGAEVDIAAGKFDFTGVSSNHDVVVTVTGLPSMGGTEVTTVDKYTVTVNRYGGDSDVETSHTMTVNEGDTVHPMWNALNSKWEIVKIVIDNKDITSELKGQTLQSTGAYRKGVFSKPISANHVVDIYMAEPSDDPDGIPVIPDYTDPNEYVHIKTKIVGAVGAVNGSITGGTTVKKDENASYDVAWSLQATTDNGKELKLGNLQAGNNGFFYATSADGTAIDPDDDNYVCYELEKVVVNGEPVAKNAEGKITVPTNSDKDIEVHVRPVLHTVNIVKYGEGNVSPSKSVYHLGNYKDLNANPAAGSYLMKVVVNGETIYDAVEAGDLVANPASPQQALARGGLFKAAPLYWLGSKGLISHISTELPAQDEEPQEEGVTQPSDEPVSLPEDGSPKSEAQVQEENPAEKGLDSEPKALPEAPAVETAETPEDFADETSLKEEPLKKDPVTTYTDSFDRSSMDRTNVINDHNIEVYFAKQATDEDGNPKTDPDGKPVVDPVPEKTFNVSATITNGEGTVSGNALVNEGGNATLTIAPGEGYIVESVKDADGNVYTPNKDGQITFNNVQADHKLEVALARKPVDNTNKPIPGDINVDPESTFQVSTLVQGGAGTISGAGTVHAGDSRTVTWAPNDENEKVAYVYVDGVSQPDLKDKGTYTFDDIDKNHHITVVFATNTNNIDTDGDGEPDTNIDDDGDGEPDVNVDTDGDGEPDINKDTDDDGKPDTDVDTDGDGKPDTNVDTDGDGKPDTNIVDEDGDGKPDPVDPKDPEGPKKPTTNVDTDGDGKPDVNIDTDDDGKPDVNIVDEDGDGKPDPIDPTKKPAPKPNVNVDTDGDGGPDVNKDTNGDGKPDVNIVDEDGDGKPDPVDPKDPEGPKKPNVNVDTDDDDKPDLNKDTDGDGKPDVNIVDEDGDGKPDPIDPENPPLPNVNIDTNGDGKPELNVDTDGDGKPDLNIVDKDKDGKPDPVDPKQHPAPTPDVNIDTNGDGKPELNVDTDGDGKPDMNIDTDGDGIADTNIDTNGDGKYDWADESHPQHADFLNQNTSVATKVTPSGTRVAPKMGDASIASSLVSLLAAATATTGGIVFVGRKRRNRK